LPYRTVIGNIYDITAKLDENTPVYPSDPCFERKLSASIHSGNDYNLSVIKTCVHCGTHIDFPRHFIANGNVQCDLFPQAFILKAIVIEMFGTRLIEPVHLTYDDHAGKAVIFKTGNSRQKLMSISEFDPDFCALSLESAQHLITNGIKLVGIDYISIESAESHDFAVHKALLGAGIPILEGLDLSEAEAGDYTLIALPLKNDDIEASPVRAILVR
jgi:arylformamidase